jgi:hypothetical protein
MKNVEEIGNCTERLLSGENPLTVFPDHYKGLVRLGVVPPRVRSLIEKIEQIGGAAKPGRFGGSTGGAGMVFAIHPKVRTLKKLIGNTHLVLTYDKEFRRYTVADGKVGRKNIEPMPLITNKGRYPNLSGTHRRAS